MRSRAGCRLQLRMRRHAPAVLCAPLRREPLHRRHRSVPQQGRHVHLWLRRDPRPACAHSCGGDPCTGGKISDSRIVVGQVVENQPATLTAVGPNGNDLTGFVVEFEDGQRATTNDRGEATFTPSRRGRLKATLVGIAATAVTVLTDAESQKAPSRVPRMAMTGGDLYVTRPGLFDGRAENTRATVGERACPVLAESPHQAIVNLPSHIPLGGSKLRVEDRGKSIEQSLNVVRFSMQADKLNLTRGETTLGKAVVEGADASLAGSAVRIQNLSTEIVSLRLTGASSKGGLYDVRIEPGMIREGRVEIPFTVRARRKGAFSLVGGVFDLPASEAATCSCGCGGTPRPACAHSCGENPCTGGAMR